MCRGFRVDQSNNEALNDDGPIASKEGSTSHPLQQTYPASAASAVSAANLLLRSRLMTSASGRGSLLASRA